MIRKKDVVDSLLMYDTQVKWAVDFENWEIDRFIDATPYDKMLDASVFEQNMTYKFPQGVFSVERPKGNPTLHSAKKEDLDQFYNRVHLQKSITVVILNQLY